MWSSISVRWLCALLLAISFAARAQTIDVGSQSPNAFIYSRYFNAYMRNGFNTLVSLPPVTPVQKFGANGFIQLFADAAQTSGLRLALVKADANQSLSYDPSTGEINGGDVYQILSPLFSYAASVNGGSATALGNLNVTGFPRTDTRTAICGNTVCQYQSFDKGYALFSYLPSLLGDPGVNYQIKGTFYTTWTASGQVTGFGPPESDEATITSALTSTKADWQLFRAGYLFRFDSGTATEKFIAVNSPVAEFYRDNGGPTGGLGLPVEILLKLADGRFRQSFEGGTIEYREGERPVLLLPVRTVLIEGAPASGVLTLRRGESVDVRAKVLDTFGAELSGRTVNWTTSNGRIVSIEAAGAQAKLRAVGTGFATITAISEGRRSSALGISVPSQCCEAGEGAPNPTVSQAIQEAIRRNRINVRIPTGAPVQRMGGGYYQEFQDASTSAPYLIAVPDPGSTGFLIKGEILGRFSSLGGLTGWLGYPSMEETPGGRQTFSGRYALAGRPVRVVQAPLLAKWALSGYETGPMGGPTSEATQVLTFSGESGIVQPFQGGIYAAFSSDQRAYSVKPPFLAQYLELDGAFGELGLPTSDEVIVDGFRRQSFEGGGMAQPAGGVIAVNYEPRKPRILITPNPVTAGSRVRIAAGGFQSGAALRITAGETPPFEANASRGAFAWEMPVAATAPASTVRVVAEGPDGVRVEGSYRIRSIAEAEPKLAKVSGDLQTGPPGALLPLALKVVLRDSDGAPLAGIAINFQPAPGTTLENTDKVTNSAGEAVTYMRLPATEGVALATATSAKQVVTFSARATNTVLPSFPGLGQDFSQTLGNSTFTIKESGALLASAANILRFYQDRGLLPAPNGLAEPVALNLFLKSYCSAASSQTVSACDGYLSLTGSESPIVNLARVPLFAGGAAVFEFGEPKSETIRDWLAEGDPVLLALKMTADSVPAGMHYVVARGIASNGGIITFDPSTMFGRSSLNDFLTDFNVGGHVWRGSLVSVTRLMRTPPGPNFFYIASSGQFEVIAERGACSSSQNWLDRPASISSNRESRPFWYAICDAPATEYQVNVIGTDAFRLDASSGGQEIVSASVRGQGQAAYRVTTDPQWKWAPQSVDLDRTLPPLNAANLQPQLAPGSLMSVFGTGLIAPSGHVSIEVGGNPLPPVFKSPFRLTVWLPPSFVPGRYPARIEHALGQAAFEVEILESAPAVFQDESGQPLITNLDGSTVTPSNPAARGTDILVYATGLGELVSGQARNTVSAEIDGAQVTVRSVDWVTGQAGVYVIRTAVPSTQAPGAALSLVLKQGGVGSIPVRLAVH